jgi:membrane protease YdiL (CAAX protease family)
MNMNEAQQNELESKVDTRRILIFLAFAFGIAWLTGLVIYLLGGLGNPRQFLPGVPLVLALLSFPYMWAPAAAHLLTRLITHEDWKDMGLRPHFRQGWIYWVIAWVTPALITVGGAAVFFLLFPQYFDGSLRTLQQSLPGGALPPGISPWIFVALQAVGGILISPVVNSLGTFGEEFGWRAYLLPKLMRLGWRKAILLVGLIWGVWHWPVMLMGFYYGFNYPGAPWLGTLLFMWIIFCEGVFLGWVALRGGSVWPAVIGHAAANGILSLAGLVTSGRPNLLLGPLPVGIVGSVWLSVLALILFFVPLRKVTLPSVNKLRDPAQSEEQF